MHAETRDRACARPARLAYRATHGRGTWPWGRCGVADAVTLTVTHFVLAIKSVTVVYKVYIPENRG